MSKMSKKMFEQCSNNVRIKGQNVRIKKKLKFEQSKCSNLKKAKIRTKFDP